MIAPGISRKRLKSVRVALTNASRVHAGPAAHRSRTLRLSRSDFLGSVFTAFTR